MLKALIKSNFQVFFCLLYRLIAVEGLNDIMGNFRMVELLNAAVEFRPVLIKRQLKL